MSDSDFRARFPGPVYQEAREKFGNDFSVGMGAESIKELLEAIDLEKDSEELKTALKDATGQKRARIIKHRPDFPFSMSDSDFRARFPGPVTGRPLRPLSIKASTMF